MASSCSFGKPSGSWREREREREGGEYSEILVVVGGEELKPGQGFISFPQGGKRIDTLKLRKEVSFDLASDVSVICMCMYVCRPLTTLLLTLSSSTMKTWDCSSGTELASNIRLSPTDPTSDVPADFCMGRGGNEREGREREGGEGTRGRGGNEREGREREGGEGTRGRGGNEREGREREGGEGTRGRGGNEREGREREGGEGEMILLSISTTKSFCSYTH